MLTAPQVPPDIIAQARFINEQRARGRKASRPKDMKRLLSEKKINVRPEDIGAGARVRWVENSTETPAVRAIVSVMKDGSDVSISVTEATTAASMLQVSIVLGPRGCTYVGLGNARVFAVAVWVLS